jgi:hypothetical protein
LARRRAWEKGDEESGRPASRLQADVEVSKSISHLPQVSDDTINNSNNETNRFSPSKDSNETVLANNRQDTHKDTIWNKDAKSEENDAGFAKDEGEETSSEVSSSVESSLSTSVASASSSVLSSTVRPRFVKKMVDCTAFPGDSVRFDVEVTGTPAPTPVWCFEEEVVEEDGRHIVGLGENGHCSLIVRCVSEDDEGGYSCRAKNSSGEATCSAELSVYGVGAV